MLPLSCTRKVSGVVDQSGSMLSDDVAEKGYALLCMAMPQTDCKIITVSEVRGMCTGVCVRVMLGAAAGWSAGQLVLSRHRRVAWCLTTAPSLPRNADC